MLATGFPAFYRETKQKKTKTWEREREADYLSLADPQSAMCFFCL